MLLAALKKGLRCISFDLWFCIGRLAFAGEKKGRCTPSESGLFMSVLGWCWYSTGYKGTTWQHACFAYEIWYLFKLLLWIHMIWFLLPSIPGQISHLFGITDVGDIASTSKLISQTDKVSKDSGLKGPSIQSRVRLVGKEPHPNTKRTIASSAKNGSSLPAMKKIQRVQPSSNGQKMQQTLQSKRPQAMLSQSHGQQSLQSRKPKPSLNGQNFRQKVSAPLAQKHLAPSSRPKVAAYNDFSLVYSCS